MQDPNYPRYRNQQSSGYQDHQGYYADEQAAPPLDPAMERVRRKMIRLLAVSIGVMLIGVMAVLVAVVYKVNRAPDAQAQAAAPHGDIPGQPAAAPAQPEPPKLIESTIGLSPGTRLLSQSLSGDKLSLETLQPDGGTEIIVYDYRESRIIGRVKLGSAE